MEQLLTAGGLSQVESFSGRVQCVCVLLFNALHGFFYRLIVLNCYCLSFVRFVLGLCAFARNPPTCLWCVCLCVCERPLYKSPHIAIFSNENALLITYSSTSFTTPVIVGILAQRLANFSYYSCYLSVHLWYTCKHSASSLHYN